MLRLPLRLAFYAFVATWAGVYATSYPPENFLWTCNIAVLLTLIGIVEGRSALPLSIALIIALIPDIGWTLDVIVRAVSGGDLFGGTEYMFDSEIPLVVRLLSFEHALLAPLLVYCLRERGYDRRAVWFAIPLIPVLYYASYLLADPAQNVNWVWGPFGKRQDWVPSAVYPMIAATVFVVVLVVPTHWLAKTVLKGRRLRT